MSKIAIIGAGAAGLMAACHLIDYGMNVTLYEKNDLVGLKLGITGKGRCNVTNACSPDVFFKNVPTNPRFLFSAYHRFSSESTMNFFEGLGVPLKIERGNRVFPQSDKASDIVLSMKNKVKHCIKHGTVTELTAENSQITGVVVGKQMVPYDAVLLCTGGASYPKTGSTGDGYRMAEKLGHTIIPPIPSLVPIKSDCPDCREMQGLSLKNTVIDVIDESGKTVYSDFGEMMFTHFGVTGPMILSASAKVPQIAEKPYTLSIDLKPALDEKTLDNRLLADFSANINRDFRNALSALLPSKMIPVILRRSCIPPEKKVNHITKEERQKLGFLLKHYTVTLNGFRPIDEAIITKGGISTKEIDPRTMSSKMIDGLYFAGEIIDCDAYTGGFNLQIAFSTAVCAADAIYDRYGY